MESISDIKSSLFAGEPEDSPRTAILIIDDNKEIIDSLSAVLREDYKVVGCLTFDAARGSLVSGESRVVLLDIKMANQDGIDVFQAIKEIDQDIRIIFHSAYPGSGARADMARSLPHSGYLTKGDYSRVELLKVIEAAFNGTVPS